MLKFKVGDWVHVGGYGPQSERNCLGIVETADAVERYPYLVRLKIGDTRHSGRRVWRHEHELAAVRDDEVVAWLLSE